MQRLMMVAYVVLALSLGSGGTLATEEESAATGAFSPAGSLAEPRVGRTATLLADGRVLVIGGGGGDGDGLASAEVWDPARGSLQQ